jgi:phospholipid/cholesterol/gamma-HCH transport system permease protein
LERQPTPVIEISRQERLQRATAGDWTALALAGCRGARGLRAQLHELAEAPRNARWSLAGITRLDHIGAQLIWQAWNGTCRTTWN